MILFYERKADLQLVSDRSKMTELQHAALHWFYISALGNKIIQKQETLTQEIGLVPQGWSSDSYETAMHLLKN